MIRDHSAYSVDPGELVCSPMLERIATKWDVLQRLQDSKKADHAEELAEVSEDWAAFVADVKARGIIVPIIVYHDKKTGKLIIADGRHRWKASLEGELPEVPVCEVSFDEALSIMESTMIGRQHFTKGQRAYAAVVLHPEAATASEEGKKSRTECGISLPDLAAKFGVSYRLIEQACQLYRELDKSKTLRAKHEWRVFAGYGLGAVIAGISGGETTTAKPRPSAPVNIVKPIATMRTFWQHYHRLGAEQRDIMLESGQKTLAETSPEFLEFMSELVAGAVSLAASNANATDEEEEAP